MLSDATPMGFIAVSDYDKARAFYEGLLGLQVVGKDNFAMVLRSGSTLIRVVKPQAVVIAPYTIFGWQVTHIEDKVFDLTAKGVIFEKYDFFADAQSPNGVWTAPGGDKVAWFKDPDGNLLSLSEHVA